MEEQEGKKKEYLVAYSVRLKRDQAEFLKTLKDAAAFICEALDAAIPASSAKSKEHEAVLLNRRIIQLQKQIERIREGEEYKDITAQLNSDAMLNFRQALLEYEALAPLRRDMENLKAEPESGNLGKPIECFFRDSRIGSAEVAAPPHYKVYHPSDPMKRMIEDAATPEEALQNGQVFL